MDGYNEDAGPPLRRIHSDETLESGANRVALEYWRGRPTNEIIRSLRPGHANCLKVKPDGRVMDGNTRIKVLEERRINVDGLPRETIL